MIFDQRVAFIGGMNLGREYRYEWHDMMVRLEGHAAKILDDDLDFAFVLEDDIGLEDNFADVVNLMANLPHANWDFIKKAF